MKFKLGHKTYKKIYRFNEKCGIQKVINLISDECYLKLIYRLQLGKKLNIKNPVTYNEKLQWLKLHDRNPAYTDLADKYEVRKYVESRIGQDYLIPIFGVWDSFAEVDFSKLPEQFVLKCTHDSGGILVCKSKRKFDYKAAKRKMNALLKNNYYNYLREWPYKHIKPRIMAEKFITDNSGLDKQQLMDYKFFCFDGKPEIIMIAKDRFGITKCNFYDMEFNLLNLRIGNPNFIERIGKPKNYNKMIDIVRKLSEGFKHIRVDLYNIDGKIYFGELTFYHWGGISLIEPIEWDTKIGKLLRLK